MEGENAMGEISLQQENPSDQKMQIDTNNMMEQILTFLIVLATISIIFSPYLLKKNEALKKEYIDITDDKILDVKLSISNIKIVLNYLAAYFVFYSDEPLNRSFMYSNEVSSPENKVIYKANSTMDVYIKDNQSEPLLAYFDRVISKDEYYFSFVLQGNFSRIKNCEILVSSGDITLTIIIYSLKLALIIVYLSMIYKYAKEIYSRKFRNITYEQKFSVVLLVLGVISNFSYRYSNSQTNLGLLIIQVVIQSFFALYLRYYVLIIYDSVRRQRKSPNGIITYISATVYVIITFIYIIVSILYEIDAYNLKLIENSVRNSTLKYVCELVCNIFAIASIVMAAMSLDETEMFRFYVYSAHSFMMITFSAISSIAGIGGPLRYVSATHLLLGFLSENLFAIVMGYLHLPYQYETNEKYQTGTEHKEDILVLDQIEEEDGIENSKEEEEQVDQDIY